MKPFYLPHNFAIDINTLGGWCLHRDGAIVSCHPNLNDAINAYSERTIGIRNNTDGTDDATSQDELAAWWDDHKH